jgi:hypothetical protein
MMGMAARWRRTGLNPGGLGELNLRPSDSLDPGTGLWGHLTES